MKKNNVLDSVSRSVPGASPVKTGSWRRVDPSYVERSSPCTALCPCAENIPAWMNLVREKKFEEAWRELTRENPFPLITGRVCYRFCEAECNRKTLDEKVSINAVERFLGEYAVTRGLSHEKPSVQSGALRVAIIGGGPAGLSSAHFLARAGHLASVFDEHPELGGMLRFGIPEYRLPKDLLRAELKCAIEDMGVTVRVNTRVSADLFARIMGEHDFVVVSSGAHRSRALRDETGTPFPFMSGLQFLTQVATGTFQRFAPEVRHVCVVGGGNTAIDASRTALRLGARRVTIIYRRTEIEMPAHKDEVASAKEEGVKFLFRALPVSSSWNECVGVTLECVDVAETQDSGLERPTLVPIPDSRFALECDMVIAAVGEDADTSFLPPGAEFSGESDIHEGKILSSGDALYGPRSVSEAIASGKKVAEMIISRGQGASGVHTPREVVPLSAIKFHYMNKRRSDHRIRDQKTLTREEFHAFAETTRTISSELAAREADRCINCGTCISCDRCLNFCPDYSITKNEGGEYSINTDMCKGCGLCADVCERGVIVFGKEKRDE